MPKTRHHDRFCRGTCCKAGTLEERRNAESLFRLKVALIIAAIGVMILVIWKGNGL